MVEKHHLQTELSEALFKAYFTDGLNIGSKEVLADLSTSVGLEKKEVIDFLNSEEGGQETADLEMAFIEKSIGAVPTYFINNKYIKIIKLVINQYTGTILKILDL